MMKQQQQQQQHRGCPAVDEDEKAGRGPLHGQLYTWGRGGQGQLGQTKIAHPKPNCALPVPIKGFSSVTHVAVGEGQQGCVLCTKADGTLWAFGNNYKGRLGLGLADKFVGRPSLVKALADMRLRVVQAAAGEAQSVCVTECGHALAWGENKMGSLGNGTTEDSLLPAYVKSVADVTDDGKTASSPSSRLAGVIAVDCSNGAMMAIVSVGDENKSRPVDCYGFTSGDSRANTGRGGVLVSWGANSFGRLGQGFNGKRIKLRDLPARVRLDEKVNQISVGSLYSGCVTVSGSVYLWGYGGHGNLGTGSRKSYSKPQRVVLGDNEKARQVACTRGQAGCKGGFYPKAGGAEGPHTNVVTQSGKMYCFGTCHKGLLCNLGDKTGAFGEPWDCLEPYLVGGSLANGKLKKPPKSPFAILPPYDQAGPFQATISAHIHCAAINIKGEAYAWGCGSNDGRCGVQRFLNGPGGRVDVMKCYMMGPHRIGLVSDSKFWAHGPGLKKKRVLQVSTGRNTMACIAVDMQET